MHLLRLKFWTACLVLGFISISVVLATPHPVDDSIVNRTPTPSPSPDSQRLVLRDSGYTPKMFVAFQRKKYVWETQEEIERAKTIIETMVRAAWKEMDLEPVWSRDGRELKAVRMPPFEYKGFLGDWTYSMMLEVMLKGPKLCKVATIFAGQRKFPTDFLKNSLTSSSSLMRFPPLFNFWTACLVIGLISVVCAAPRPVDNAIASLSNHQSLSPSSPFSSTIETRHRVSRNTLQPFEVTFLYTEASLSTRQEEARAHKIMRTLIKQAATVLGIERRKRSDGKSVLLMPGINHINYPGHWTYGTVLEAQLVGPYVCGQGCTLRAIAVRGSQGCYDMDIRDGAGNSVFSKERVEVENEAKLWNNERLKDRFNRLPP
ncbi:hypothetical protein F5890DRAFT_1555253 [Lentinula detonsa]|uniref:Uncharacterized protein n=1 Tax=Lentinula detonsa TaxID=2804962 RepID=A0AA38UT17_9AGAR|nr:hypothetical protein F5890DRAFT_1555253 [Lentinula detonsa]